MAQQEEKAKFGSYKDRINKLTDKLVGLHNGLEQDRSGRIDHLNLQMKSLDDKLATCQDASAKKFGILKEQIAVNEKDLDEERNNRERLAAGKTEAISIMDQRLQSALDSEQKARREAESRILTDFEERTNSVKMDIAREGQVRVGNESKLREYLEVDIPKLYETLKEEVIGREAMEQRMLTRAMDEVMHLQEAVLREKQAREDTEEAMMKMMEDIIAKVQAEMDQERQEREQTEETLLLLLDSTCNKLCSAQQRNL
jgi:hypothetical protein